MPVHSSPVCAIVGAGPGNGYALACMFAAAGYRVALLARNHDRLAELATTLPGARAYACDVTEAESITTAFTAIAQDMGPVDTLIYNAGKGVWGGMPCR